MKLALVTGGMKRVGAAISARLAAEGWTLALHCGHEAAPDAGLAAALTRHETSWHGFQADLADDAARTAMLQRVFDHFGVSPALLVNNAGLFSEDDATSITDVSLRKHQAINVNAPVLLATQLLSMTAQTDRSCVINILDQRIAQPHGDQLSYTLSKQALSAATITLAKALAPRVRVNAVAPGLTLATPDYAPGQIQRLAKLMPLQALPDPAAVAAAVAYLAGAALVTGQTLFVDGGAHLRSFERDFVYLERN
jgi:NAD(P)-dependent dehydrogenase (short-subunit alcohol dehydrogenase family)